MAQTDARTVRPTLLLTRPLLQAQRFAAQVQQRFGADRPVVMSPLMQMRFFAPPQDLAAFAGVIFSSENGVAAMAAHSQAFRGICYCVGQRTATAAGVAGWQVALTGPDVKGLADAIIAAHLPGPLLHLHGQHVAGNLSQRLVSAGTETVSAVVYDQEPQPPTDAMKAVLAGVAPVLVPLFSPRSASLFQQAAQGATAPVWVAALSQAVADALSFPAERLIVAARPDGDAMLDAIGALLSNNR